MDSEQACEEVALDLRAIRLAKGLTLIDLASSTRISPQNLKAIEEQSFELLPEPIYARAFIDMYARALDVDGEQIRLLYEQYRRNLEPVHDSHGFLNGLIVKKRHREVWIWVMAMSIMFILAGFFSLYQWGGGDQQITITTENRSPAAQENSISETQGASEEAPAPETYHRTIAGEQSASPEMEENPPVDISTEDLPERVDRMAAEGVESTAQLAPSLPVSEHGMSEDQQPEESVVPDAIVAAEGSYTLVIEASELTWIQIDRDGEPPFEIMLRPGDRITERASERLGLLIGNAGGVDIRFQGKALGPLGGHGEVIHLTLPPRG